MPQASHVLLIDHSQEVLDQFQRLLEREGYRDSPPAPSSTGANSWRWPRLRRVREIFAVGGLEVGGQSLALLRRDPAIAGIPVVLWTTAADLMRNPARTEDLAQRGVRVVITPMSLTSLVTAMAEVLAAEGRSDPPREPS